MSENQAAQIRTFVRFLATFGSVEVLTDFPTEGYITLVAPTWALADPRDIATFVDERALT